MGGSRQHILNSPSYSPSKVFCFDRDEGIAGYQPVLLMRKDFPLRKRIDEIIRNAFESGLFEKWDQDSSIKARQDPFEAGTALTLEQYAVFLVIVYIIGCILSTLSLIAEFIVERNVGQDRRFRIWIYLQYLFDGKRHYWNDLPDKLQQ